MKTEYTGPPYLAMWHEVLQRGLRTSVWRAGYELRKRLGLVESYFRTEPMGADELCGLFTPPLSSVAELRRVVHQGLAKRFLIPPDGRERYGQAIRQFCPGGLDALLSAADEVCRGRFGLMGQTFDFAGGPIDWHLSPETGRSWPRLRWNRIRLRGADAAGDVKYTWELNRHQCWPTLGRAYWLTGDDRYAEAWVRQIGSWLDNNPPEIGVNWLSNLEHALRILNWWVTLAMFLPAPELSDDLLARIIGTTVLKARHILADLDYSRINMPNNHLLGDCMGLAVMGLTLPELAESARWREVGLGTLWNEAKRQIHPDGASFECAVSYHRFVAYFYTVVVLLCRKSGVAVPDLVERRLQGMFEFVLHLRRPEGSMPSIGDWDDGRAIVLSEPSPDDFRPMLSTGAVLFDRPDMAWAAGRLDEETIWLLGPQAGEAFASLKRSPPRGPGRAFPQGGYFISRSGWSDQAYYAVIRNGPFDSHTHADLLNIELSALGRPILVDPGTYTYNGPWPWRTYFRSARAHNALIVDGQGQALAHRVFRWLFPPTGRTLCWQQHDNGTGPFDATASVDADGGGRWPPSEKGYGQGTCPVDYYEGEHNGFRRLPGRPVHRRVALAVRGEYWLVLDILLGRGSHEVELPLHFHPSMDLTVETQRLHAISESGVGATVVVCASSALDIGTARGREDPIDGWFSPGYGRKVPSTTVRVRTRTPLPMWVAWLVAPFRGQVAGASLYLADGSGAAPFDLDIPLHLTIELGGTTDDFYYSAASAPVVTKVADGFAVPVGAAWVRRKAGTGSPTARWSKI
jgi:hypothetical protein